MLDETDLAIFHALEISPRAPWTAVGSAVGIDAVTAARRWDAMVAAKRAYVTCYPLITRDSHAAFLEITCRADRVRAVAATIAEDPYALRVDIVSGGSALLVLAGTMGAAALNTFILDRLPTVPGVHAVVAQPVVAVHAEGGFAAPGALPRNARRTFSERRRGTLIPSVAPVDDLDWRICLELSRDGRAPIARLSRATGASPSTITRRLRRLVSNGALHLRAGLAPSASPQGALVWLSIRVPPADVSVTVRDIGRLAGVTSVSLVAGAYNLLVKVALPHLAALEIFEATIQQADPGIRIVSRRVVLDQVRSVSRIFDVRGDAVKIVSIDLR